jgi:hypothetical protein
MLSLEKSTRSRKEFYLKEEKNNRHEIVITSDSLSTIMAAGNRTPTKNPKIQTIRMMLDDEGPRITLQ